MVIYTDLRFLTSRMSRIRLGTMSTIGEAETRRFQMTKLKNIIQH